MTGDPPHSAQNRESRILEDVQRREFLKTAGAGLAVSPLMSLTSFFSQNQGVDQIRAADIGQIRDAAAVFSGWDHTYGGTAARAAVGGQLRWAAELLNTPCPGALRADAFAAVAQLFMVAGFMAFDAYAHDDARILFAFATECAEEAGDWHLRAKVYSHRSRQAIWCGDPDTGITYADLALVRSDRLSAREKAMLHTARARGFAKLGMPKETLAAVDAADSAFTTQSDAAVPEWMGYYDAAQHAGDTGHALWDLATVGLYSTASAKSRLQEAVDGHRDTYARSRAISGIKLASLQMHDRDIEYGVATATRALEDMSRVRSRRAQDDLRQLRAIAARTPDAAGVEALDTRIKTLVAAS